MRRLLIALIIVCQAFSLGAQDVSTQQERKRRIEEEITFIDGQLRQISGRQKANQKSLVLIQSKVASRRSLIRSLDEEIAQKDRQIRICQSELDSLQASIDTLQGYFTRLIYRTYKNRSNKVWFMYVLASEDIGQGWRRLSYLKSLSQRVNSQAAAIIERRAEAEALKERLVRERDEARQLKASREGEYRKLVAEEKESKKVAKELEKSKSSYKKELEKKRREVNALNKEIERLVREAQKAAAKQGKGRQATDADPVLSGEFARNKGRLPWPVRPGVITESYGVHYHPVYKNLKLPDNNGVTISTTLRNEVKCVFDGVVSQIIVMPGYHYCVLVQHGEYYTFYCKIGKVSVRSGEKVSAGSTLGTLEVEDGSSSLHFQIWKGTRKQNPENWLAR